MDVQILKLLNYNIEANEDDSSCCYDIDYVNDANNQSYNDGYSDGEESVICPENICPADLDGNGYVSTSDLLIFLNDFGQYCDVLDACGVINGDGSTCADQCGDPVSHEGYDYATVQSVSSVGFVRTVVTSLRCRLHVRNLTLTLTTTFTITKEQM